MFSYKYSNGILDVYRNDVLILTAYMSDKVKAEKFIQSIEMCNVTESDLMVKCHYKELNLNIKE